MFGGRRLKACVVVFGLSTGVAQGATEWRPGILAAEPHGDSDPPKVFLYNASLLAKLRTAPSGDAARDEIVWTATAAAEMAMKEGPFSVTQKKIDPPSGDKHDYMSQAPYFWSDPSKPDGLPYIRRDGERNPDLKKISDHDEFGRMGEDARALALAFYLTGNRTYGERSALLLRTWFLDPATRMNPNLEYGQGIPGINTGRGIGIIESRSLTSVTDAVGLLAGLETWTSADQTGMEKWLDEYLIWMQTSKKGRAEDAAKNNHGTWYDLQVVDLELFLGKKTMAVETLNRVKTRRIAVQIESDGRQPLELARTNAWDYSNGNLDGLMQLASLGSEVGVDLWSFRTADGRSIRKALDFLVPYAMGTRPWPYKQISGFHGESLLHSLERAAAAYRDPGYKADVKQLGGDREDFDTVLLRLEE